MYVHVHTLYMRISENHNSLGCEQLQGLDVKQLPNAQYSTMSCILLLQKYGGLTTRRPMVTTARTAMSVPAPINTECHHASSSESAEKERSKPLVISGHHCLMLWYMYFYTPSSSQSPELQVTMYMLFSTEQWLLERGRNMHLHNVYTVAHVYTHAHILHVHVQCRSMHAHTFAHVHCARAHTHARTHARTHTR